MQSTNILLVEDVPSQHDRLENLLNAIGYQTDTAKSGEEGLNQLNTCIYDIVISDLNLPDMDGIDMIGKIKDIDATVVPIVMTSHKDQSIAIRALESGARGFLKKPVSKTELQSGIEKAIQVRQHIVENRLLLADLIQTRSDLQEQAIEREHFLHHLLDAAPIAIYSTGGRNQILTFNKTAQKMYGYTYDEVIGKPAFILWAQDNEPSNQQHVKMQHKNKRGQQFPVLQSHQSIRNHQKQTIAQLYMVEDLSEKEKIESQLAYAERLSLLGQMAPRIAHEFKAPIQIISGYADLALNLLQKENIEEAKCSISRIPSSAKTILKLVNEMSNLGKPSHHTEKPLNLFEELKKTVEPLQQLGAVKYCKIKWHVPQRLSKIFGDAEQIEQVFRNLILNAAHAMEKTSPRILSLGANMTPDHTGVEVHISDTGTGIAPKNLERIFDPFFTTKPEGQGTGLGLAIVKTILNHYNATLAINSRSNEGTHFKITFPCM